MSSLKCTVQRLFDHLLAHAVLSVCYNCNIYFHQFSFSQRERERAHVKCESTSLWFHCFLNLLNYRLLLAHDIHGLYMCHCSSFQGLWASGLLFFVEVASGGIYFGCKVKHLLSCSVSTGSVQQGYYCTCVLCKCMPDGRCCCCCCMYREGSSWGEKREREKEEAL